MTKAIIPIIKLQHDGGFPLEASEIFGEYGYEGQDEYTYTMRVTVENKDHRRQIAEDLGARLFDRKEAERLVKLLDENDWDVSFLVDTF